MNIKSGNARGVLQKAYGSFKGEKKIELIFKATIGEEKSIDKITIKGTPSFTSIIDGGINGDIATCAITINTVKSIVKAPSGLQTMKDIAVPGFIK